MVVSSNSSTYSRRLPMKKQSTFKLDPKISISLMSVLEEPQPMATLAVRRVLSARSAPPSSGEEPIKLILETRDPKKVERYLQKLRKNESAEKLSDGFYSLRVDLQRA